MGHTIPDQARFDQTLPEWDRLGQIRTDWAKLVQTSSDCYRLFQTGPCLGELHWTALVSSVWRPARWLLLAELVQDWPKYDLKTGQNMTKGLAKI